MTEDELPPYEPWVDALLAAERKVSVLPSAVEARLLERLLLTPSAAFDTQAGDPTVDAPLKNLSPAAGPAPAASPVLSSVVASKSAITTGLAASAKLAIVASGVAGLLVGAAVGVTGYATLAPPKERIVTRIEVREVQVQGPAPVPADEVAVRERAIPAAPRDASVPLRTSPRPRGPAKSEPIPSRDIELADENALITRAQNALARGRADEALEAIREHERGYPRGRFVEEREALEIQALAKQGNLAAAQVRAERFYQRYPNSLLTRLVRAVVKAP